MLDSPFSDPGSDPTLSKLLEADSELAAQEVSLLARLGSVREQRQSLKSVILLFAPAPSPASTTNGTANKAANGAKPVSLPEPDMASVATAIASAAPSSTPRQKTRSSPKSKAIAPAPTSKTKTVVQATPAPTKKRTRNSVEVAKPVVMAKVNSRQIWQKHVRDEFRKTTLPNAVAMVMERHPNVVFGITDVVNAIFVDEMPRDTRNQAQNRVSNILSAGAKDSKWYRGKMGHYSVSKTAALTSLAS